MLQVASVLHRMESSNGFLHVNIHTALKTHYLAISVTEARRNEDVALLSQQQQQQQQHPGDYFAAHKGSSLELWFLFPRSALRNLPLLLRRPADGRGAERPHCRHKEAPQRAVVRSSDGSPKGSPEPAAAHGRGKMPLS